jgi:polyvinyl alcohol dehydrogenase (cytochrome)
VRIDWLHSLRLPVTAPAIVAIIFAGAFDRARTQSPPDGAALYSAQCASCHEAGDGRAPSREALKQRSPQAVIDALTSGSMRYQGMPLNGVERRAIAEYVTERPLRDRATPGAEGRCRRVPPFVNPESSASWSGWSPSLDNAHFQSAERAGLSAAQVPRLKLKWAFGFEDAASAWSQATIAGGRVFIGSQNGAVYSLDAATGCIAWTFTAHAGVRAAVVVGVVRLKADTTSVRLKADTTSVRLKADITSANAAYFGDQAGYVYAVDAARGRLLWSRKVDDHPLVRLTGAPVLHNGRLYVPTSSYEEGGKPPGYSCCTFRGSLVALDARSGEIVWKAYTIQQPPTLLRQYADGSELRGPAGGAIWSAPTIDLKRHAIYVGVGNTYSGAAQKTTDAIVAFDLKTGAMQWAQQMSPGERDVFGCAAGDVNCIERPGPDFDFGASPVLVRRTGGRDLILAGQKSGVLYALDPDRRGAIVWRYRAGGGSGLGGIQWGIASDGALAFAPVADIYADEPGGLHAVDVATGTRAWHAPPPPPVCGRPSRACSGAQFSAVTSIPGVVFSPSNDGAVRAYSTKDGSIVWSFDSNREFQTVNGVKARGGSMYGPAPTIAGGMLYISSGYGTFGLRPGNVLLAFGVE